MTENNSGLKPSSSEGNSFLNSLKGDLADTKDAKTETKSDAKNTSEKSTIGNNIQFRGELIGREDLHIEGRIEGTVIMEGQNLTIGEQGELDANIHAQNIIINGKLTGDVLADELIEIKNTAVVKGNLIAPRIQLEDGGKFRGSMDMVDTDEEQSERRKAFKEKLIHPDLPVKNEAATSKPAASSAPVQPSNPIKDNKPNSDVKPANKPGVKNP